MALGCNYALFTTLEWICDIAIVVRAHCQVTRFQCPHYYPNVQLIPEKEVAADCTRLLHSPDSSNKQDTDRGRNIKKF
jgi:hypothetical protein